MPDIDVNPIPPATVYRALSPTLAQQLAAHCRIAKENPADVIADALALHFDELAGTDPALIEPAATGAMP